jgi:hypothetical protein
LKIDLHEKVYASFSRNYPIPPCLSTKPSARLKKDLKMIIPSANFDRR